MKIETMSAAASGVAATVGTILSLAEMDGLAIAALIAGVAVAVWSLDEVTARVRWTTAVFNFLVGFLGTSVLVRHLGVEHDLAIPVFAFLIGAFGHPAVTTVGKALLAKLK